MSRNDTAIEVHAGATMGRASFALLRAYPNLGGVSLQENEWTRLSVAVERLEAVHNRNLGPEQRGNDERYGVAGVGEGGRGVVRPLNKQLSAVAMEADTIGCFTLAISVLGLVPHVSSRSRTSLTGAYDAQQKMLQNVRALLRQTYAVLVRIRGAHPLARAHTLSCLGWEQAVLACFASLIYHDCALTGRMHWTAGSRWAHHPRRARDFP